MNLLPISVDLRRFPGIRKLAADYTFQFASLAPFFSGDPQSTSAWRAAIDAASRHPRRRAELSAVIAQQLHERNAPAPARDAAAHLADARTVAIVTGQQAGLFGGPLYTLYKAVTALKLAARLSEEYGVPALAIFWVESEDHDWEEIGSVSVLDSEWQRRTISLAAPPHAGHRPVASLAVGPPIGEVFSGLASALPPTEFTSQLIENLRTAYAPECTMSGAFARWMDALLGPFGLVVFDCADARAKPLVAEVFARELEHPGRTWALARDAGHQLVAAGYHAQVDGVDHDAAALFRLDGQRVAIAPAEAAPLAAMARSRPEAFSPNVLLRPIVEDTLFPTVAYVSGPNELAYLAQLRGVYEQFGVPMPLVVPRASATILDSAGARFQARHDVAFESLQAQDDAALNRLLAASLPPAIDEALHEADRTIAERMAAIVAAVPAIDPTLEGAARSTLGKLQHDLAALRGKVINAAKKRDETLRRQFHRLHSQAFPDGMPQERAIAGVSMLNRFGPAFIDTLLRDLPLDPQHHWILTL